jgi:hypothetical protein
MLSDCVSLTFFFAKTHPFFSSLIYIFLWPAPFLSSPLVFGSHTYLCIGWVTWMDEQLTEVARAWRATAGIP